MGKNKKHRARKTLKRSVDNKGPQPLRYEAVPKRSKAETIAQTISPKRSSPIFDAEALKTFTLSDFIEMAMAGRPYPDEPTLSEPKIEFPHTITAVQVRDQNAEAEKYVSNIDAVVERVLERPRFRLLRDSVLCDQSSYFAVDRLSARGNLVRFLSEVDNLFNSLADRQPGDIRFWTSFSVPVGELDGRFNLVWSAIQANPLPALFQRLLWLLARADPKLLRRCAFAGCRRPFYARRKDSVCCSPRCNNTRHQRKWYSEHGKSAVAMRAHRREERETQRGTATGKSGLDERPLRGNLKTREGK